MKTISSMWQRTRRSIAELASDCRGLAATEFAFIVPLMLVMFFGTVEFSSGVAVDRKVSLMARTLADLTSQNTSVTDTSRACNGAKDLHPGRSVLPLPCRQV
jgi:Flp pilus assembly protein TadG